MTADAATDDRAGACERGIEPQTPLAAVHARLPNCTRSTPWSDACATSQCAYCQPACAPDTSSVSESGVSEWTNAAVPQSCLRMLVRSESARGPRVVGVVDTLHATAADLSPINALARIVASLAHLA